jgi:hypothetical protein
MGSTYAHCAVHPSGAKQQDSAQMRDEVVILYKTAATVSVMFSAANNFRPVNSS